MGGQSQATGLGMSHHILPSGPPFVPASAANGLSVDLITGKIVLGQVIGQAGDPAILLSDREVPLNGFRLNFKDSNGGNAYIGDALATLGIHIDDFGAGNFNESLLTAAGLTITDGSVVAASTLDAKSLFISSKTAGLGLRYDFNTVTRFSVNSAGEITYGRGNLSARAKLFVEDRIGDGSPDNAPSRMYPETALANVATSFALIPKGTGASATYKTAIGGWNTDFIADDVNWELWVLSSNGAIGNVLGSYAAGTGIIRPIIIDATNVLDHANPVGARQFCVSPNKFVGINTNNPTYLFDVWDQVNSFTGIQTTNVSAGNSAQVLNRSINDNGSIMYSGVTSSTYNAFAPTANGRAFVGCFQADLAILTQSAADIIFFTTSIEAARIKANGTVNMSNLQVFATNALALAGGLVAGDLYRSAVGVVSIVF